MEITFDSIISVASLLLSGGGLGVFFTLRWVRAKAKSEAKQAEAEAKQAEAEAKEKEVEAHAAQVRLMQQMQDTYQEMLADKDKQIDDNHKLVDELRADRDHYKEGYIEMRDALDKLGKEFRDFRNQTEEERAAMKRDIARNGRQVEALRPFLCANLKCQVRQHVIISDDGEVKPKKQTKK